MWHRHGFGVVLALPLVLAGCATPQPATPLPNPAQTAMHEWDHGPPWGPEEQPWVTPPQVLAYGYGPGYWGPDYWGPGYWGPSVGFGRGYWWRGHRGYYGGYGYGRYHLRPPAALLRPGPPLTPPPVPPPAFRRPPPPPPPRR